MKFLKKLLVLSITFLSTFVFSKCSAMNIDKVIIGTWLVPSESAEEYVTRALKKGFRNIDTAKLYKNEEQVGKAIKEFKSNNPLCKINVTTKFKVPSDIEVDDLNEKIENFLKESIENLGHVDEFLLHELPEEKISLFDVLDVFIKLSQKEEYKNIKFGLSNVGNCCFYELDENRLNVIKVIQNPYWIGSEKILGGFYDMGKSLFDFCREKGIKYETYKTLGHGLLLQNGKFSASDLVNHSIEKGFYPIVKASSDEHLESLCKQVKNSSNEGIDIVGLPHSEIISAVQ